MDQIEEVSPDFVQYKNEQCIQIRFRDGIRDGRVILTNTVSIYFIERQRVPQIAVMHFSGRNWIKRMGIVATIGA